jgi:uncharacterized protein (DUF433 family)
MSQDSPTRPTRLADEVVTDLQAALALTHCVEVHPKRLGGVPTLKGTRFPIAQVLSQLADGDSIDDLAENFDLDREQLSTLLHALAACLNRPFYR